MCALSFNDAVCKMDTRKEELRVRILRGVALPDCRSGKNREGVRSVIQHRAGSSFFFIFPVPRFSFFYREHSLCPRPLPLRFPTQNVVSKRTVRLSFFLHSVDLRQVLFPRKSGERSSREKNALEISFAGQFIEDRKHAGLSMRTRNDSISRKGLSTHFKLCRHQFYKNL